MERLSVIELFAMFPDEQAAQTWFEDQRWPDSPYCPRCGSLDGAATVASGKPMPWRCSDCRSYFSVRTGTVMEASRIPLRKWVIAMFLVTTDQRGISSVKLGKDIAVQQKTAWFMLQRIREAWVGEATPPLSGTVEVDETFIGGKERFKHYDKRLFENHRDGKTVVIGGKSRDGQVVAQVIPDRGRENVQDFIQDNIEAGSTVYTDEHKSYKRMGWGMNHESINHKRKEYVRDEVHTNSIESFWVSLKGGYRGTYRKMSPKHLQRYVTEFAARHNLRDLSTMEQMAALARGMVGKRLTYKELTDDEEGDVVE